MAGHSSSDVVKILHRVNVLGIDVFFSCTIPCDSKETELALASKRLLHEHVKGLE